MQYGLPLTEAVPLFAALLSLPLGNDYTPLTVSPAQQKQQTLHALLTVMVRIAARQPTLFVMEDLHWVDPATLEFLTMLVDQGPTARILALFTFRPDFSPPWMGRAHLTQVTLSRLPHHQATEMTRRVAYGKALPPEVVAQIVAKTDGVPLFVEELTKMVLESGLLREGQERYELTGPLPPLAIPATLHDSLMARLDRLATVKGLAQLGAVLGREFSYELLQAVAPWDAGTLQQGLQQLVEAEFLYQRGLPPQAMYLFKHALIQDAAYQSLLRSTRQQYHQRIAQVLEARFLEVCETQPELLAHHYTEAGLIAQAIPYWQRAGQRALAHSANVEAIGHLTKGLTLLEALPDTPARAHQELLLLTTLGPALMAIQGYASPEAGHTYARARALCQQVEETPQLARVFYGLWVFYHARAEHQTARELVAQFLTLAHRVQDPALLLVAHCGLAQTVYCLGELAHARTLFEQGLAFYNPSQHRALAPLYGTDPTVTGLSWLAWDLWLLGYPDQAEQKMRAALVLAHELGHSLTRASALCWAVLLPMFRRDAQATHAQAKAAMEFSTAQGLPFRVAQCMINHGWALAALGNAEEGLAQLRQGLEAWRATGAAISWPYWLNLLADTYAKMAHAGEGLAVLAEALACVDNTGERYAEAELHRLHGELLLQQTPPDALQAESCFRRALAIARRQEAKSWELRAAMSLSRLWQQQGKQRRSARAARADLWLVHRGL